MLGGGNVPGGASPGGGSLFERLEQAAGTEPDAGGHVIESIKRHLVRLLNAHPGNSASAPDLGLLDFNDATLGTHDLKLQIRGAIRRCIETFEPRVRRVEVVDLPQGPDPLQLRFQVTVYLNVADGDDRTTIDLVLDDKRYYRVV
ncbi:type VI secretion system baseplate subunit TssE [Marinobacter lutaoensis]|jgi:type VI secretion system protein|uniref:Type VI secretion protein n=1 Tax=Marinobacter lutaoensis TaxID=135739 RepID=A0A1V2DNW0_9GAMM|nr:type VI secretion system baseplate subunit TssE [Marinobacter lutaoensis]MAL32074.1 type VI secretion system baseplate subunit TssE [Marinobacter sp.]MBI43827.1 type VI secretion system baseplate subunit TssE [Oceanospirillales bacterium]MBE03097.1 type VI secretion system baseplate subunit TssE [Marinobacter sp.]NVD35651.1 type VI secretion system baseplate subunit TssE [Marinobacter lutaoensis]ONF42275.1 type VI secretion protein [Marinobacter lutaoensis]|tara:strand:- start:3281 stop:3715 length:435 start_codon:yes stop_codon:yes gene_type:complete